MKSIHIYLLTLLCISSYSLAYDMWVGNTTDSNVELTFEVPKTTKDASGKDITCKQLEKITVQKKNRIKIKDVVCPATINGKGIDGTFKDKTLTVSAQEPEDTDDKKAKKRLFIIIHASGKELGSFPIENIKDFKEQLAATKKEAAKK